MSDGEPPTPRYTLTFGLAIAADLEQLNAAEPAALDAAQAILEDLARGRVTGKLSATGMSAVISPGLPA